MVPYLIGSMHTGTINCFSPRRNPNLATGDSPGKEIADKSSATFVSVVSPYCLHVLSFLSVFTFDWLLLLLAVCTMPILSRRARWSSWYKELLLPTIVTPHQQYLSEYLDTDLSFKIICSISTVGTGTAYLVLFRMRMFFVSWIQIRLRI